MVSRQQCQRACPAYARRLLGLPAHRRSFAGCSVAPGRTCKTEGRSMSATDSFRAALRRAGLDYVGLLVADGRLRRFKATGDRERNSWFVLHAGPPSAGAFGCWRRGVKEVWCERNGELSQGEWNAVRQRWK